MATATVDTSWEALTDLARALLDEQDRQRWALGEIADTVQSHYGERSIQKFCEQVKAKPKTIYQYAAVYRFYPRDAWKEYPLVRYTQWRDAMRLKDASAALQLLARFNDDNMRMEDFYKELETLTGKSTSEKIFDGIVTVSFADGLVTFDAPVLLTSGAVYHVTIKEVSE